MSLEPKSWVNQFMVATDPSEEQPQHAVSELGDLIDQNALSLLEFIKSMGSYLTDDTDSVRTRALNLMSSVLAVLKVGKLALQDTKVLFQFFTSKLEDSVATKEVLKGFIAIVKMDQFPGDQVGDLLAVIREKYTPVGQLASTRYQAFQLLEVILDKFQDDLVANYNEEYISTFVHVTTSEKDPQNLMESFKLNKRISTTFDITAKEEDMFDCAFCYFPISFRAPANNPYDVTGDDLKGALRDCLSSNDLYAKDAFPNLVEKLSSTSPAVKMDTLKAILQCIERYSSKTIEEYWLSLWNSLKFEILHRELCSAETLPEMFEYYENAESEDEKTVAVTLHIFETFSSKFTDPKDQEGYMNYLILVFDDLSKYLAVPDDTKVKQSSVIMSVVLGAQLNSYNLLITRTLETLLKSFKEHPTDVSIKDQRSLLSNISFILDAYYKLFNVGGNVVTPENAIFNFKDDIMTLLSRALLSTSSVEVTLRCLAIRVITKLFKLNSFLQPQECELVVQTLDDVLVEDPNTHTFGQTLNALTTISDTYPMIILQYTVPKLLSMLPENSEKSEMETDEEMSKEKVLDILLTISDNRLVTNALLIRLLNKLESVLQSNSGADESYYSKLLMLSIAKALGKLNSSDSTNDYIKKFVPRFLSLVLTHLALTKESCIYHDSIAAEYAGRIMRQIISDCDLKLHKEILKNAFDLFFEGKSTERGNTLLFKPLDETIDLLDINYSCLWPIFTNILATVAYKNVTLPRDPVEFVQSVTGALDDKLKISSREAVLETMSLVVNKWFGGEQTEVLSEEMTKLQKEITTDSVQHESIVTIAKPLEIYTWITKALLLKNADTESLVAFLIDLLEQKSGSVLGKIVPKCFEILVADPDCYEVYSKVGAFGKKVPYNVNVRRFYKQKFVDSTLPELIKRFRSSGSQNRGYLTAISVIIKYADKENILPHLEEVMPVLLTALGQRSGLILSSALTILEIAIDESPSLVKGHLSTVVPRLLQILQSSGPSRSEEVKEKVLECLVALSRFPLQTMSPYRGDILAGCEVALDDDRRRVRKMACDCRQEYYELGVEVE